MNAKKRFHCTWNRQSNRTLQSERQPSNTKHLHNICTMLAQRRRRWADVVQMLYKCFVLLGGSYVKYLFYSFHKYIMYIWHLLYNNLKNNNDAVQMLYKCFVLLGGSYVKYLFYYFHKYIMYIWHLLSNNLKNNIFFYFSQSIH